ncbi:MAG: 3-methyl-2-oxobutanoate dehydrogenase subunit VorB [Firmicutes bacterium]|nr:3-methyl-2-oxobutanoate dehydrogenase subunit VorB [Bacillota bacterium]
MKGNEAIGEAAIRAGCRYFFGYPITPQSELPEYMARRLPAVGGVFLQAESEIAAINMVYGAAGAGARVMTSSSSPGISLKQEGISYLAGAELPAVIVNVMRGGPGLGSIQPGQSDYFQATKGGGHGDYRLIVLAPASVQEIIDLTWEAFALADQYRNPVMILSDGMLGQMMEPVVLPTQEPPVLPKPWATTGAVNRERNEIFSFFMQGEQLEEHNRRLEQKWQAMVEREKRVAEFFMEDAEIVVVAYGTTARIARRAVRQARQVGIKAGLLRPISLWPFPDEAFQRAARKARVFLSVEMSLGQMVEDVRLAVNGQVPVHFYGRVSVVPSPDEIFAMICQLADEEVAVNGSVRSA